MQKSTFLQLCIIALGLLIGAYFSNKAIVLHQQIEHGSPTLHTNMDHGLLEVGNDSIVPTILQLHLEKDKMSGWNLWIETQNFTFTPSNVNQAHLAGQGHAHLYINGQKYARLYSPHFHLPELIAAENEIRVTLNTNGHETMAIGGKAIEKIMQIGGK